jgi:hypothetical protein
LWRGRAEAELPIHVGEDGVECSGAGSDVFLGEHVDVVEIGGLNESGDRRAFVVVLVVVVRVGQRHPVMEGWVRLGTDFFERHVTLLLGCYFGV